MNYEKWKPIYEKILREFGYDEERDKEAAKIAMEITKNMNIVDEDALKKIIFGKPVSICGAAMATYDIARLKGVIISADEATSILLKNGIVPDIITTDLDGNVEDIIEANRKGSLVVVHAHGDNIGLLKKWLPQFEGKIMLTTQAEPFGSVKNFGGFTDGDRAYCIARHFHACRIFLIGFDFENVVEKEGKNTALKARKLKWAERIIKLYGVLH